MSLNNLAKGRGCSLGQQRERINYKGSSRMLAGENELTKGQTGRKVVKERIFHLVVGE